MRNSIENMMTTIEAREKALEEEKDNLARHALENTDNLEEVRSEGKAFAIRIFLESIFSFIAHWKKQPNAQSVAKLEECFYLLAPRNWDDILSLEEKKRLFIVQRELEEVYLADAYRPGFRELFRFIRNTAAHFSERGFSSNDFFFQWVDSKFPWFFPAWAYFVSHSEHQVYGRGCQWPMVRMIYTQMTAKYLKMKQEKGL